ncbi:hypothetical protein [Nocardia pseudovaccinii]|uniref:hypothetical protein n=1 Tax=Nocardia pseudovaccinii TaxID=189540 RepID=UPI0007A4B8C8|nr:hypothetical protein [Nocardia pseudovaccinii]
MSNRRRAIDGRLRDVLPRWRRAIGDGAMAMGRSTQCAMGRRGHGVPRCGDGQAVRDGRGDGPQRDGPQRDGFGARWPKGWRRGTGGEGIERSVTACDERWTAARGAR